MKNRFRFFGGSLLLLAAMTACSENEWIEDVQNPHNAIQFSASAGKQTRGVIVDNNSITNKAFGVYAYNTGETAWDDTDDAPAPNFMNHLAVIYENDTWKYKPLKYWPVNNKEQISFFAYWPLELATDADVSNGIDVSTELDANAAVTASVGTSDAYTFPTLTFTQRTKEVDSKTVLDAANMVDFVVARSLNQSKQSTSVTLPFKHVLTRVSFTAATESDYGENDKVYITGLKIKGTTSNDKSKLFTSAAYTLKGQEENSTWNTDAATKSTEDLSVTDILKTVTVSDESEVGSTPVTGVVLNKDDTDLMQTGSDGKHYLFLIPPYGKEGVKANTDIEMVLSYTVVTKHPDRNNEITQSSETVTIPMPEGSLQEGVAYNIRFLIGLSAVTLVPNVVVWEEVPDKVTDANYINVTAVKNASGYRMNKKYPAANCVMVSIPTVGTAPTSGDYLNLYQAYLGWKAIETLENDGKEYAKEVDQIIRAGDFEIVTLWNDHKDAYDKSDLVPVLKSDYQITGTDGYGKDQGLTLDATKSNLAGLQNYFHKLTFGSQIANGQNVMVAMKFVAPPATPSNTYKGYFTNTDGTGGIIWSWHYWVTDYNPDAEGESINGQVHSYDNAAFTSGIYQGKKIMDRNLGATITGLTEADIDPSSLVATDAVKYYGLYYQHGRKDPFRFWETKVYAYNYTDIYDTDNNGDIVQTDSNVDLSVRNPDKFFNLGQQIIGVDRNGNWTKEEESLWGIQNEPKSVFDPSPAGWRVPVGGPNAAYNPWAGFYNGVADDVTNVWHESTNGGVFPWVSTPVKGRLYKNSGVQAWYPAGGYRTYTYGNIDGVGDGGGYIWSASVSSQTSGYSLGFAEELVYLQFDTTRAYGFPVRCVQE